MNVDFTFGENKEKSFFFYRFAEAKLGGSCTPRQLHLYGVAGLYVGGFH